MIMPRVVPRTIVGREQVRARGQMFGRGQYGRDTTSAAWLAGQPAALANQCADSFPADLTKPGKRRQLIAHIGVINDFCLPLHALLTQESPKARVQAVVAIVAHHEVAAIRYDERAPV